MSFIKLDVVLAVRGVKFPNKQQRFNLIQEAGGLHFTGTPWEPTARKISKLPWVDRVVVTHVDEHNIGTWRKGRKS